MINREITKIPGQNSHGIREIYNLEKSQNIAKVLERKSYSDKIGLEGGYIGGNKIDYV